jgi:hypothetical protein
VAEKTLQYRVCWAASTNASFGDEGEWHDANPGETVEEIEDALSTGGRTSDGFETALSESGFEWWAETRKKPDVN